jgi:hypothetical protein
MTNDHRDQKSKSTSPASLVNALPSQLTVPIAFLASASAAYLSLANEAEVSPCMATDVGPKKNKLPWIERSF